MRITIKGITPSTIAFNTLKIVIRGDSRDTKLYPESIARHIEVSNEDQLTEVNSLINGGYIRVETEDAAPQKGKPISPQRIVGAFSEAKTENQPVEEPVQIEQPENGESKVVSKRGRPKGAKDSKPRTVVKRVESTAKKVPAKKTGKKPLAFDQDKMSGENMENTKVVVMTPSGAVEAKAKNTFAGEIEDSERTQASLEAMRKLEQEEKGRRQPDRVIDESKLDPSEQMGREAVVATDGKKSTKVKMRNSILPEADQIKNRGVEFIEDKDDSGDDYDDAFIES